MAESDAAGVTYAEMPRLDAVPHDIKLAIVWDEGLAWDDVAALRLTSRSLVEAASTRLFYTVTVSKLHRDRDSFLTICRTPRLARHVCEVEWLELLWDAGFAERVKFPLDSKYSLAEDEDGDDITPANETLFHDIELAVKAAFWLPNHVPGDDATEVACQTAVAAFLPEFQAAVDSLPRLHTFVSRSMPPLRVIIAIGDDNEGYPLSAGTLQAHHATGSPPPPPPQTNDGFFLFLAPTMARPTSAVTRLRWVDEQPGFSYTRAVPAAALARLTQSTFASSPASLSRRTPSRRSRQPAPSRRRPCSISGSASSTTRAGAARCMRTTCCSRTTATGIPTLPGAGRRRSGG